MQLIGKIALISVFLLSSFSLKSQLDFKPTSSVRFDMGLPAILETATNRAFRDLMQGLASVSGAYQYTLDNSLSFGAGAQYTLFNVNEFRNNFDLSGNLHIVGLYGRVGVEKYYGSFGVDYGLKVGYTNNFSHTSICLEENGEANVSGGGLYVPEFKISYMINEYSAFAANLSYTFHSFRFTPETVCVDQFPGLSVDDHATRTSYLTFGFGYIYYF